MTPNTLPKLSTDTSETGCCPRFDPLPWNEQQYVFADKLFLKETTWCFLHIPLNMGSMMRRVLSAIESANAKTEGYFMLSHDCSPWKSEHFIAVSKDVPGAEIIKLSGTFLTKTFEGPFKDAGKWCKEMNTYVEGQGKRIKKLYFYYTTCPKCLQTYGKNYVVGFAEI